MIHGIRDLHQYQRNSMKILEVLEATEGGTRTHLDAICTGLARDFEIHLVYSLNRSPSYAADIERYEQMGIACHEIPMQRKIAVLQDRKAARALSRLIRELNPRIIHAHSSKAGYLSRTIDRPPSAVLVYTPHCLYFPHQKGLRRFLYEWGETRLEPATDVYIAVSDEEKEMLISRVTTEDKIRRIDNGVSLPNLPSSDKPEQRVLFPARAVRQKGWEFFLETAESVHGKEPDIHFVFAGTGPQLREVSDRVRKMGLSDCVSLPGFVEDMDTEYTNASLVAVTSRWEGQPYSVLEAMSYACPVAAFDIRGINEIVTHGREGLLAPPFNCSVLADHIIRIIRDPDAARTMGMNGRMKIEERYTRKQFLDSMRTLYEELAG